MIYYDLNIYNVTCDVWFFIERRFFMSPKFMPDFSAINQQISNMEDEQKKVDEWRHDVILFLARITDRLETIINYLYKEIPASPEIDSSYYEDIVENEKE